MVMHLIGALIELCGDSLQGLGLPLLQNKLLLVSRHGVEPLPLDFGQGILDYADSESW